MAAALAAGADLAGFLHHPASPRHCRDLALAAAAGERAVLVAVTPDADQLLDLVRRSGAPWVQPYLPAPERERARRQSESSPARRIRERVQPSLPSNCLLNS